MAWRLVAWQAVHRETAESTNARVMWWTFAEVVAWHDRSSARVGAQVELMLSGEWRHKLCCVDFYVQMQNRSLSTDAEPPASEFQSVLRGSPHQLSVLSGGTFPLDSFGAKLAFGFACPDQA